MFCKQRTRRTSGAMGRSSPWPIDPKAHLALGLFILASLGAGRAVAQLEITKIFDPIGMEGDTYGLSVDLQGDTAAVGAPYADGAIADVGAAFIHQQNEGGLDNWGFVQRILMPGALEDDAFGQVVALSGDTLAVGAPGDDQGPLNNRGSVHIYYRDQGGLDLWGFVRTIPMSGLNHEGDLFGNTFDLCGDTLFVGVPGWEAGSPCNIGTVFVYYRDKGGDDNWGFVRQIFTPPPAFCGYVFGSAINIDGDLVFIGARGAEGNVPGSGAVYIHSRNQGGLNNWGLVKKIYASDGQDGDKFGTSIGKSGDTLVVGATKSVVEESGAAYVFDRNEGDPDNWGQVAKLSACDEAPGDFFGFHVAVGTDHAYVAAHANDDACPGNDFCFSGNVYIFDRDEGGLNMWGQVDSFVGSEVGQSDHFGHNLAVDGDRGIIAATFDEGQETNSGAVYVFECLDTPCPSDLNTDGVVGVKDLLILLGTWGNCPAIPDPCPADFDCSGAVGVPDLLTLLGDWGNCPCDLGLPPPSLDQVLADACVSDENWNKFKDKMMDPNASQAEKDNYYCWMDHHLFDCTCLTCWGALCPGPDPYIP